MRYKGITFRSLSTNFGVPLLLGLVFCLKGAKDPCTFLIWATPALICLASLLYLKTPNFFSGLDILKKFLIEIALLIWIILAQFLSTDSSVSLYPTTQAMLFLLLWIALLSSRDFLPTQNTLIVTVTVLSLMTLVKTLSQYVGAFYDLDHFISSGWSKTYGFLPTHPTFNATFICSATIVLLSDTNFRFSRWLGGCLAILVILSPSRISLLALAAGLTYLAWPRITARWIIGALASFTLLVGLLPNHFWQRRLRLNEGNYRIHIWNIAKCAVWERPLTGNGFGNFELMYEKYSFPVETDTIRYSRTTSFAHNEYLEAASALGVSGFVLFLILVTRIIFSPIPKERRPIKAALISLCITAFYIHIWHVPFLSFWTILLAAMIYQPTNTEGNHISIKRYSLDKALRGVGLIFFSFCAISLGWSAFRYEAARKGLWQTITRWNSRDATAWQQWAFQQKDLNSALNAFARAVELVPENVYFQEAYARALEQSPPLTQKALNHYLIAIQNAPHRAINTLAVGRLLYRMNDFENALDWFKKARRIEPHYWECDLWIARCWQRLKQPQRADWTLRNLIGRRNAYFLDRKRMARDLPTMNAPSDYEATILAYDFSVIAREFTTHQ